MRVRHSKYSLLSLYNSLARCDAELAKQHSLHYSSPGWQHCAPPVTSKGQKRSSASQDPKPQAHQASCSFIFPDQHFFSLFSTFKSPQRQSEWCHQHCKLVAILIKSGEMKQSLEIPSHLCSFPSMVDSAVFQRHPCEACIYTESHHCDVLL